ncbi:Phage integrase family protein [Haloarcula vallismortis]|uniref:Integrase-like protein n=2 Tax=Haloarcula vallismortis TaxID=28442 RepID=M0J954_HALVA|nr:tyrosine-type recombinase/integrase [Haloarcula vallismortis]EMA04270.1 integrase-like protein [Haloarcula vallismortis ATCC 29715]SDX35569.1 Phage integrase family protein [Haloarcula vallismortis]
MAKSKKFNPLDIPEAEAFDDALDDQDDFLTELTGRVLFNTGMRSGEFTHMRTGWVRRENGGGIVLTIPKRAVCTSGRGPIGQQNPDGTDLHSRGQPCTQCRNSGETNDWTPKTENGDRTYPLTERGLEDVGEDLLWYFERNDQIPFGNEGVNRRIRRIAEDADLADTRGRDEKGRIQVTSHDLRHTYGTRLARMGFDPAAIRDTMGWGDMSMAERYIEFTGIRKRQAFADNWDPDTY